MADVDNHLPVIQTDLDADQVSCSPSIYVSNEEAALLAAMRDLREQSIALRRSMPGADPERRAQIDSEIEDLRAKWQHLAARRERAFVRKMIMLGHLPPNHPVDR